MMGESTDAVSRFKRRFLFIYFLAQFCEYLQGPYMYALHSVYYHLPLDKVGLLFFTSSLTNSVFGCIAGPLIDTFEKTWGCMYFCLTSIASCLLTTSSLSFYCLLLARALGGIASSLLETAFESYAVCEHHSRGFSQASLDALLAYASGGAGIVAVFAGLAAAVSVKTLQDLRAPFFLAAFVGAVCLLSILLLWRRESTEADRVQQQTTIKHGISSTEDSRNVLDCLSSGRQAANEAVQLLLTRREARVCSLLQIGFEVPLDLFVLLWANAIPTGFSQGLAFAALMVGLSLGSCLFIVNSSLFLYVVSGHRSCVSLVGLLFRWMFNAVRNTFMMPFAAVALTRQFGVDLYRVISVSFFFGSFSLLASIATTCPIRKFAAYMAFEVVIGILYPALSSLRAIVLPDSCRASASNLPRVIFNLFVLGILGSEALLNPTRVFAISALGMAVAGGCAIRLANSTFCEVKSDANAVSKT